MGGTGDEASLANESVCIPKRRKRDDRFFFYLFFSTPCQRRKPLDFKVEREGRISCFIDLHILDSKKTVIRSSSVRVIIIYEW